MEKRKKMWLSKEEKAAHVAAWQESKLSKASYCNEQQICYGTFVKWLGNNKIKLSRKKSGNFIPVQVDKSAYTESNFATISFGVKFKIELHQSVSAGFMRELLLSCK